MCMIYLRYCTILGHVAGWDKCERHDLAICFPGLDLYSADPAQLLTTARGELQQMIYGRS